MSQQLSVLIPNRTFTLSMGDITLKPFKFKQFPDALKLVEKYLKIITSVELETTGEVVEALLSKAEDKYILLSDICTLIELVSEMNRKDLDSLTYDEVLGLLTEIVEMNMDFFNRIGKRLNPQENETNGKAENPKIGESVSAA